MTTFKSQATGKTVQFSEDPHEAWIDWIEHQQSMFEAKAQELESQGWSRIETEGITYFEKDGLVGHLVRSFGSDIWRLTDG